MKKPWLFRVYRGWKTTQLYRDYIKTIIRIPTNQSGWLMESKVGFFDRGSFFRGVYHMD